MINAYLPFLSTDPQLVECAQTGEDTATEPSTVATFGGITGGMNLNLENCGRGLAEMAKDVEMSRQGRSRASLRVIRIRGMVLKLKW